jgi:hypothetical protein
LNGVKILKRFIAVRHARKHGPYQLIRANAPDNQWFGTKGGFEERKKLVIILFGMSRAIAECG